MPLSVSGLTGSSLPHIAMVIPVIIAETIAAIGRAIAIGKPINAYVIPIESTPVSGVDTKKLAVLALLAPLRRIPIATGITEHEHKGNGAPISAAVTTGRKLPCFLLTPFGFEPPKVLTIHSLGNH